MPLFGRKKSGNSLTKLAEEKPSPAGEEAPSVPDAIDVFDGSNEVFYTVTGPWQWVMEKITDGAENIHNVEQPADLPTAKIAAAVAADPNAATPSTPSARRRRRNKAPGLITLRLEIPDANGEIIEAVHASSEAFDGLEDKDELVRTLQRCRCEHLELSPPSRLLNWDVTKEECMNLVGDSLPGLLENADDPGVEPVAVLKEPMGSSGTGIFFVKNATEIHDIIEEHRKRAVDDPEFLDNLIAAKGRIPSWVLQAEVRPALLIRGRRKFHIRSYVVALEKIHTDELLEVFIYNRHEARIASEPVPSDETESRARLSHITNGATGSKTERVLIHEEPELAKHDLQGRVELFIGQAFGKHFVPDMQRRVSMSAGQDDNTLPIRKFAIAGLDLMVTEDFRIYLLEANISPISPPKSTVGEDFQNHLVGFMKDLIDLVVGKPSENFVSTKDVLTKHKMA